MYFILFSEAYKDGDESKLMAFMDFSRRTKNEQTASIWVFFRGQYESIIVTDGDVRESAATRA